MGYDLIFVGMDASSLQLIVYESALRIAKFNQAELRLLHCVEAEINSLSTSAVSVVGTFCGANYLFPSDVHFQFTQQALETRLSEAKQWLQEYFLGSVSNYVLHHAPCSVLVVQGKVA